MSTFATPTMGERSRASPALLSVVIPAFNEGQNIVAVTERLTRLLETLPYDWEVVLVDDGSRDETFEAMGEAAGRDARIRAIRLSRNFGSHVAITAGLEQARGDACLVITADLEEPPELIPSFLEQWRAGHDVVWGVRAKRAQGVSARLASAAFHSLFRIFGLADYSRQAIGGGFFLVDRRAVEALRQMRERNRTIIGLLFWVGFSHGYVTYDPSRRNSGQSKWTLSKRLKLAIDSFVSFSYVPMRLASALGMTMALLSFLYGLGIVLRAMVLGASVEGWPTLMAALLFLSGLQLIVSGTLGEYLWRALDEARARPLYIVAESTATVSHATAIRRLLPPRHARSGCVTRTHRSQSRDPALLDAV